MPTSRLSKTERVLGSARRAGPPRSTSLAVAFPGRTCAIELRTPAGALFAGPWEFEACHQGHPLTPVSDWEETCWESDKDVDYLELAITLGGGYCVQRHFVLAKADRVVLLADVLCESDSEGDGAAAISDKCAGGRNGKPPSVSKGPPSFSKHRNALSYCGRLAIGPQSRWSVRNKTREIFARFQSRAASVVPLALPQWLSTSGNDGPLGSLRKAGRHLELVQPGEGRRLFAPLWLDLNPRRLRRAITWRRLTVGESLEAVPPDVAVSFRVGYRDRQWLVYRSLGPVGNRTFLGHNACGEFLAARFLRSGKVERLIETE